jgi:hypothetical protein
MEQQNNTENNKNILPKKKNYIKTGFKVVLYIILSVLLLNILLYVALSIPFVQQKVLGFAVDKIKEITKTEVRVDEIRLSLFNNVELKGIYLEDQSKDTLVYAQNLNVSLSPWKLLQNKLQIDGIQLNDFTINVSQQTPESDFNFQFLIDAFAGDTTSTDTTSSSLKIDIEYIVLNNGRLKYDVLSEPSTPGEFNASHIQVSDLNGVLKLPSIDITNLDATLESLSLKEHSGLEVVNLKGNVTSKAVTFFAKDLQLKLPNSILTIPSAKYNLLTSEFELNSDEAVISPIDVQPFMADLKYLKNDINLKTSIKGKLPAVNIDSLILNYGEDAQLRAAASISDYEHYDIADFHLGISSFMITPNGVSDFARLGDSTFVMPDILKSLGVIRLSGDLKGQLSNLQVKADAWAKHGAIQMLATGAIDTTFENYKADVKLQTQNFNLGQLLENPDLGQLAMNVNLIASQTPKHPLTADVKGLVNNLRYNKQDFNNIPFTAYYNAAKMGAWLKADLPQGKIEAKADMSQDKIPKIDLDLNVEKLQLDKFAEFPDWKNPELSFNMKGNIVGLDINKLQGSVELDDLKFSHDSLSLYPGKITLDVGSNGPDDKYIKLASTFFKADITGKYDFITLPDEMNNILSDHLPGIFKKTRQRRLKLGQNNFVFNIVLQNTDELEKVFELPFNIEKPILIGGVVNTIDSKLKASASMPSVKYGDSSIENTILNLYNTDSLFALRLNSKVIQSSKELDVSLTSDAQADTINTLLHVKSDTVGINIDGTLNALAHFEKDKKGEIVSYVQFKPTFIDIGKLNLNFMAAKIVNENNRTSISNFGFFVGRGRMMSRYLGIDGVVSDQRQDTLNVNFTNANLGDVFRAFDINNVSTIVNGDIKLANVLDKPEMYTKNFSLNNIILFNDTLGDLSMSSRWSDTEGAIKFLATLGRKDQGSESMARGLVYPAQDSMRIRINLDRLSLKWMEPFMAGLLNKVSGSISSELMATGRIATPSVKGWLGVNDAYFGIDYTNVTYHVSDTIDITPDKIGFDNLVVEDIYKNKGVVNALVTHKDFKDMRYNLDMSLKNLLVLNTQNRTDSLFYGKVFASGTANIKGSDKGIDIKMNVRNEKNSVLNVQIPQTSDAYDYQGIVYINTPKQASDSELGTKAAEEETTLPMKLAVDLNVNNNISLGVIINPLTGDAMQIEGSGLVKFSYDLQSEAMNAFGNYVISKGKVKLKLQNISTMEFIIEDGSKLILNGDPMKTNFAITAYKRVKADLSTLDESFATGNSSPKVNVDCVLGISGNMTKMNLTYDIRLPDAPDDLQQKLKSYVATDDQRTRQFAYLLVMGAFYSNRGNSTGGNIADGLVTSIASSALSNGLNAVLGNMLGSKWQLGTNISSNDGTFSDMDMSVSLSRTFLDDKLKFNTNLGYRTDQSLPSENSFIGDFDVEYALTRAIKLKVFNKTNDQFYKQAPTTQGIGVVYTKEAKTIKKLFQMFRKKRKRPNKTEQTESTK